MDVKQLALLGFQISLVCTVLSYGLRAAPADLLYLVRRPGLLARSLIAVLVVMPVFAVILTRWLDFPATAEIALICLAISPLPPMLARREVRAGGHMPYALGLMVLLAVLSVAVVPLAAYLLGTLYSRSIAVGPADIALTVAKSVLAPLAVGMAVRLVSSRAAERIERPVQLLATALIPVAAIGLLVVVAPALWPLTVNGSLLAIVVFLLAGFLVGHHLGGPEPEHAAVLAYATACRHPGIAMAIAAATSPDRHFGATIVLYLLAAFALGTGYRVWHRRANPTA